MLQIEMNAHCFKNEKTKTKTKNKFLKYILSSVITASLSNDDDVL